MTTFYELDLNHQVVRAVTEMGFEFVTPIQEQTIPHAIAGHDVIGQAQTGTGKTAAFGIPLIEKCAVDEQHIQGIVITPTRELAVQVAEELNKIGRFKGIRALAVYGGQDIRRQILSLKKKPHIIVGTPGRLMDHMDRKTIRLHSVEMVVLDEADEMLNMGFIEDIEKILSAVPSERQTLLFSATMPKAIQKLAETFMVEPITVKVKAKEVTVANIVQQYIEVAEKQKFDTLCRLLDIHSPELAIVFGRTKRRVDELSEALGKRGYKAEGIHGDLTQAKRESVLRKFKAGLINILVATDVAARGLDISGVSHVFNFDMPQEPESYVHRIGRTGRAGKVGMAITLVTPREMSHLKTIEQVTKRQIESRRMPNAQEALEEQKRQTVEKLMEVLAKNEHHAYETLAKHMLKEQEALPLLAAALKMLTKEPDMTPVTLTGEAPLRTKKSNKPQQRRDQYRDHRRDRTKVSTRRSKQRS